MNQGRGLALSPDDWDDDMDDEDEDEDDDDDVDDDVDDDNSAWETSAELTIASPSSTSPYQFSSPCVVSPHHSTQELPLPPSKSTV